ncbi:protein obstructor-E [Plodia interpunctella]|uniref:protein obstructor-E n=1 Tax=Plodia interpunctella TaxID=58824 RepID=UPI002367B46F|nr:protein obstructor-E [Plodia interpunctella]
MAFRCVGVVLLCLTVLASSAVPKTPRKKPANQPARVAQDAERDAEITNSCPDDGFFADAEQCDKYYECRNGEIIEKLCPDGMVFNDYSPEEEKCDLPFNIDCSQRPKLQTPIKTLHCPRLNGYFSHEDPKECGKFYYCVDGKFNMITCPDGLVYNEKTGICTWPDEAKKKGCGASEVFKFDCPAVNETFGQTHPRYADPEDCQFFYVCINGNTPRRSGCKLGQAFDDVQKRCEWARKVPECADWYKGQLTDAELDALENPPTARPKVTGSSQPSRRKPQRPGKGKSAPVVDEDVE